jgi:hypothetical protein
VALAVLATRELGENLEWIWTMSRDAKLDMLELVLF